MKCSSCENEITDTAPKFKPLKSVEQYPNSGVFLMVEQQTAKQTFCCAQCRDIWASRQADLIKES